MTNGIYTVANDVVYDQLVALLNSIEANAGGFPVCVIAYDNQLERVRAEIATRDNVTLLDDESLFVRWEDFSTRIWSTHPTAFEAWRKRGIKGVHRIGMNRRYCVFDPDSLFERFIYLDADTLVLASLEDVFKKLDDQKFVVYDYQYKHPEHIYNLKSSKLPEIFDPSRIETEIFCAGFYASKQGIFPDEQREWLLSKLEEGESEVLYYSAPNQSVLNYMVMRSNIPVCNLIFDWSEDRRTGNSVTNPNFEMRENTLYENGKRLTYLHYIGLSSKLFNQVSVGENIGFPYRDVFLHYRFLHESQNRPKLIGRPKPYNQSPSFATRVLQKIGLTR